MYSPIRVPLAAGGTCSGTWPVDQVTGQVSKAPNYKGTGRNEAEERGKTKAAKDLRHGSTAQHSREDKETLPAVAPSPKAALQRPGPDGPRAQKEQEKKGKFMYLLISTPESRGISKGGSQAHPAPCLFLKMYVSLYCTKRMYLIYMCSGRIEGRCKQVPLPSTFLFPIFFSSLVYCIGISFYIFSFSASCKVTANRVHQTPQGPSCVFSFSLLFPLAIMIGHSMLTGTWAF